MMIMNSRIVDYYFKDRIFLLKAGYVVETLGEYNIMEFWSEDL